MDCVPILSVPSTTEWGEGHCWLLDLLISNDKLCEGALYLKTSATERFVDKADHKNLFVLLKEYSGMRCSVGPILTVLAL